VAHQTLIQPSKPLGDRALPKVRCIDAIAPSPAPVPADTAPFPGKLCLSRKYSRPQVPLMLELQVDTHKIINCLYKDLSMKTNLKRKNTYLDAKKIGRVRTILGAKTETEAIDAALYLVVFRKEILKSLEKVAGKGGVKGF
jgi:hypothetical protein